MTSRYGLREGVVEALLILGLTLAAAPLRGWLEERFHKLFQREAALYRQIVSRIGTHAGQYKQLPELLHFVEDRTTEGLGLRRVQIIVSSGSSERNEDQVKVLASEPWSKDILAISQANDWSPVEDAPALVAHGFNLVYPLRREDRVAGLLLIDGAPGSLTPDARAVLEILAGQVAIAIEDCRLVEENVRLERQLAEQERLAVLGQMAATVAHEIKNPLSAIKSIAQVMSEDQALTTQYARDLTLIVGETDRLNQSITQLLSFARKENPPELPRRIDELVQSLIALFQASAEEQQIKVDYSVATDEMLTGAAVSALRDSLLNLLLNALQATPLGGQIHLGAELENGNLLLIIEDSGPGITPDLHERIWEPFFTTKQRGTGLGLAIVRKRMQEAGGSVRLATSVNGGGARFELRLPLATRKAINETTS